MLVKKKVMLFFVYIFDSIKIIYLIFLEKNKIEWEILVILFKLEFC